MYACDILRASERVPLRSGHVANLLRSATALIGVLRNPLFVVDKLESVCDYRIADLLLLHLYLNASVSVLAENAILVALDIDLDV